MLDYGIIQKAKGKLEAINDLVETKRQELQTLLKKQEEDWNNVEQNKKIKSLQEFVAEYADMQENADATVKNQFNQYFGEMYTYYMDKCQKAGLNTTLNK